MRRFTAALFAGLLVIWTFATPTPVAAFSLGDLKIGLVTFLLEKVSVPGQFEITADKIARADASSSELVGVHISDANGEWFFAERFILEWSPSRLLKGEVEIDRLEVRKPYLKRLPVLPPPTSAEPVPVKDETKPSGEWPRSPIAVLVREILITGFQAGDAVVPGGLIFDGKASLADDGDTQSAQLSINRTDATQGAVNLSYVRKFNPDTLSITLKADEAPGGLVAILAGLDRNIPLSLQVSGNGTPADWNGTLGLEGLPLLNADGKLRVAWQDRLAVKFDGALSPGLQMANAARQAIGDKAQVSIAVAEGDEHRLQIERAQITSASVGATVQGWMNLESGALSLDAFADVSRAGAQRLAPSTQPLTFSTANLVVNVGGTTSAPITQLNGTLVGPSVPGMTARSVQFTAAVSPGQSPGQQVIEADLALVEPRGNDPALEQLIGKQLRLVIAGLLDAEKLDLNKLTIRSAGINGQASGIYGLTETPKTSLRYRLAVRDLRPVGALLGLDASGRFDVDGKLTGSTRTQRIVGHLVAVDTVINGEPLGAIRLKHDARIGSATSATLDLTIDGPKYGTGRAKAKIEQTSKRLALRSLDVNLLGLRANGDIVLENGPKGKAASGSLDIAVDTLDKIARIAGLEMTGTGTALIILTGVNGGTADIRLDVDDVTLPGIALAGAVVSLKASRINSQPVVDFALTARDATVGGSTLDTLTAAATGPMETLVLELRGEGRWNTHRVTGAIDALANVAATGREVRIDRLDVTVGPESIVLENPTRIAIAPAAISVEKLGLLLSKEGKLLVDGQWSPRLLEGQAQLEQVPLRFVNLASPGMVADGFATGTVQVSTGASAPRLALALAVSQLRVRSFDEQVGALRVDVGALWDGARVDSNLVVTGDFGEPLKAQFGLPMTATQTWQPKVDLGAPLDGTVDWRGRLEKIFGLLPLPDHLVSGATTVDIKVGGTLKTPQATGEVTVGEGRYENLQFGTIVNDLSFKAAFATGDNGRPADGANAQGLSLSVELAGDDGAEGKISARGEIAAVTNAQGNPALTVNVDGKLEQMFVVRSDAAHAQMSGTMSVTGDTSALAVNGRFLIDRAELRLLNSLPPSVADLGDVQMLGEPVEPPTTEGEAPPSTVSLDVEVQFPQEIFIRGRGLDSEWGGRIAVTGTAAAPMVVGRIESRRGQLELIGRIFSLNRGQIVFSGAREVDPILGIRLQREANGITGRINVEGTASSPELSFSSTPAVSEDEVLARVLFGRSSGNLSATEALQLAAGVAALTQGEAGVVDNVRDSLGLDVLRVESGDAEGESASASVGRYVRNGVYVGAKQSLDGKESSVVIEVEVRDDVVLDADVGVSGSGSVGVTWRRNF
jgi:translocation and assembly module TamB